MPSQRAEQVLADDPGQEADERGFPGRVGNAVEAPDGHTKGHHDDGHPEPGTGDDIDQTVTKTGVAVTCSPVPRMLSTGDLLANVTGPEDDRYITVPAWSRLDRTSRLTRGSGRRDEGPSDHGAHDPAEMEVQDRRIAGRGHIEEDTMPTTTITVGLDHTPAGMAALRYAVDLAATEGHGEVLAIHAFELPARPERRLERNMSDTRRELLDRCQCWIDDAVPWDQSGVLIRLVIRDGNAATCWFARRARPASSWSVLRRSRARKRLGTSWPTYAPMCAASWWKWMSTALRTAPSAT